MIYVTRKPKHVLQFIKKMPYILVFNLFKLTGIFHSYQLDKYISVLKVVVGSVFICIHILIYFCKQLVETLIRVTFE